MRWLRRLLVATLALAVLGGAAGAGLAWHRGYRLYILHTGSMEPTYPTGSVVIDRPGRDGYHVGEVITFRHDENTDDVVTHRIVKIQPNGLINTKGDGNKTPDVWNIAPGQVEGSVVFGVKDLGYALVFFRQPTGIAAMALAIASVVLLWGLFFPPEPEPEAGTATDGETAGEEILARGRHALARVGAPSDSPSQQHHLSDPSQESLVRFDDLLGWR